QIVYDGGNRGNDDAHPKEEPVVAIPSSTAGSQTLSRGIRVLEILSEAGTPLSIDETASRLGVHRSNAYRLVRTLEEHGLVGRDPRGGLVLGARLAALAAGVDRDLQAEALPELTAAANELGMTCFVAVLDREECVTLTSVEPRHAVAAVAQRPGTRHFVGAGSPGGLAGTGGCARCRGRARGRGGGRVPLLRRGHPEPAGGRGATWRSRARPCGGGGGIRFLGALH